MIYPPRNFLLWTSKRRKHKKTQHLWLLLDVSDWWKKKSFTATTALGDILTDIPHALSGGNTEVITWRTTKQCYQWVCHHSDTVQSCVIIQSWRYGPKWNPAIRGTSYWHRNMTLMWISFPSCTNSGFSNFMHHKQMKIISQQSAKRV